MNVTTSTVSLTVEDVPASAAFFTTHLGYKEVMAADGFASLAREDAAVDIVLLQQGIEVLPPEQRDVLAAGLIVALTVSGGIAEEERRLSDAGVEITMPLREEPWGEKLFQVMDPSGVIVQIVEWAPPTTDAP